MENYMDNLDILQPTEYKVVETIYDMDDEELSSNDSTNGNYLLRDDLQSLDKNVLDHYGVVLDFNEHGKQMARTTKRKGGRAKKRKANIASKRNNQFQKSFNSIDNYKKIRSISHH